LIRKWDEDEVERENVNGTGPLEQEHKVIQIVAALLGKTGMMPWAVDWLEDATQGGREGDEKMTFIYGL